MSLGIHDKWPVGVKRLVQRLAAEQQELAPFFGIITEQVAFARVKRQLGIGHERAILQFYLSLDDIDKCIVAVFYRKVEALSGFQFDVKIKSRRMRLHGGGLAVQFAHHHLNSVPLIFNHWQGIWIVDEGLRVPEFFLGREVEPNLKTVDRSAFLAKLVVTDFFVNGAAA